MAELQEENPRGFGSSEHERRGRQITFDVYVGRIPADWTKEKLLEIFQPFGEIKSVDMKTGSDFYNGQQIAFVRFSKEEMAKLAVDSLLQNPVENVELHVNIAQKKPKEYRDRQGNLDFGAPRNRTYNELKRTNQGDHRRGRTKQFGRNENTEYGGGYGSPSHIQKKDWGVERHKTREEKERIVLVTEVESPVRFWCQLAKETVAHHLARISDELQSYCPTGLKVPENSHQRNKIYGGIYPVDNLWYRCSIVKFLSQGMVSARYVDFGNTETIKKETLVELPPSLADARPFAQPYNLADCTVSTEPGANEMTYALGIEQLKNIIIGKLVHVKVISENSHGGANALVSLPGDSGKTINEMMVDGECVERLNSRSDKGRIEKSVAEKPLNEQQTVSSPEKSPSDKTSDKQSIDNLKLTVKYQAETICNLNKIFETVKQQNADLCSEIDQAIKIKAILTAATHLHQSRSSTACGQDRTNNIDLAISLVTDKENRLTLDRLESFKKLCSSSDALKLAQDSIRSCEDKEKLKEMVESRNKAREEQLENTQNFLKELSSLNVTEREQKLEETLQKLSVSHSRYDGEVSLEEAIANYKDWKLKPEQNDLKSVRETTDEISRNLAAEFMNIAKMLDPDDDFTVQDYETVQFNSIVTQYREAVANEAEQNQNDEDPDGGMQTVTALVKCLKKELLQELNDVRELRSRANDCTRVQGDLETSLGQEPDVSKILEVRKNLKAVKSKFRHKLADKKDLEETDEGVDTEELQQVEKDLDELRSQLHSLLVEEKSALEELAEKAVECFPELPVQYPEFGLLKFIASNGLVRQGWEHTYYSHGEMEKVTTSPQTEVSFLTEFNGKKCLLKEYNLEDIPDLDRFESQAATYSRIENSNLMKVEALFYDKTHRKAFIQLPYYPTSLKGWLKSDPSEKAKRDVICDLVRALSVLHKAGITHGSVIMDNIYVDNNNSGILGEYCFNRDTQQRVSLTAEFLLQNSAPVSCDTSPLFDMFCLGEIAWVVFLGDEPITRDLTSLQKHSQSKAVSLMLTYVLAFSSGARPTASQLLQHPFFTDENYFDIMDKTAPSDENIPDVTEETSAPEENTVLEKDILPAENTPEQENAMPEVCTPPEESTDIRTIPDENGQTEENVQVGEIKLNGSTKSEGPEKPTGAPEESTLEGDNAIPGIQPPPDEKPAANEEIAPSDETSSLEEALPDEYAATSRKLLLEESDLPSQINDTAKYGEEIALENCNGSKENEIVNGGTQGS